MTSGPAPPIPPDGPTPEAATSVIAAVEAGTIALKRFLLIPTPSFEEDLSEALVSFCLWLHRYHLERLPLAPADRDAKRQAVERAVFARYENADLLLEQRCAEYSELVSKGEQVVDAFFELYGDVHLRNRPEEEVAEVVGFLMLALINQDIPGATYG